MGRSTIDRDLSHWRNDEAWLEQAGAGFFIVYNDEARLTWRFCCIIYKGVLPITVILGI